MEINNKKILICNCEATIDIDDEALSKYNSFQTPSGGFSYWPSYDDYVDEWGTNYAGHFILEAKN